MGGRGSRGKVGIPKSSGEGRRKGLKRMAYGTKLSDQEWSLSPFFLILVG